MYCRDCQYDLRGQTDMRCPECARAFDRADPQTFLARPFGRLRRTFEQHRRRIALLLVIVYAACIAVPALLPRIEGCGGTAMGLISAANLKHAANRWTIAIYSNPGAPPRTPLDMEASQFERRLSPYAQRSAIHDKYAWIEWLEEDASSHAVPLLGLCILLTIVLRKKARRICAGLTGITAGVIAVCVFADPIITTFYAGDRSYIHEYEYVPVEKWTPGAGARDPIIAYEKGTIVEDYRVVAFKGAWVTRLREEEFQALAAAQGIVVAGSPAPE